jgi:TolB protein
VAYTAFVQRAKTKTRNADLFIYDLGTGTRWLASFRQGINSGAAFDTKSSDLYLTISQGGSPDIYKMSSDGTLGARITNGPRGAMNVEPSISPDGRKIAFSSDRSGNPMIYTMDADGSNAKRVTFAGKYNATPSWSPDGKRLAFAGWSDDHFDIFTMNSDGTEMIRITSAKKKNGKWAQNETPVFSPDGRQLMYTSNRTGTYQIYISNLDGSEERRITNDEANYFSPKWSKNIE